MRKRAPFRRTSRTHERRPNRRSGGTAVLPPLTGVGPDGSLDQAAPTPTDTASTRRHIRGSSLLLAGRLVSLSLNFLVQVLTVRYLSKPEFGAFGYAIAFESMASSVALFGLDKAVARFVPLFHERKDYARMFGTIVLTLATVLGIGVGVVALTIGGVSMFGSKLIEDPLAVGLVMILVALAPLNALDCWFQGMFAVFASPRAIFMRRHVVAPGVRLLVVLGVILSGRGVHALALGYVLGGLIGVAVYASLLVRLFRRRGIMAHYEGSRLDFPAGDVFGFSVPLLTSDALMILKSSMVVMLLGYFSTTVAVAEFKAVWPIAGLNLVVMQSFRYLYTPLAARMFARNDNRGINDLYWRTAIWIAVMSFPIFAVSFSMARPLTELLFGSRYADSAHVLSILAVGNYFNAALGFNSYTLRVYGKVGYIVAIDVVSALISLALSLTLIPPYGASGAALATCGTLIVYNLFNHAGLLLGTGVHLFDWRYLRVYAGIAVTAAALLMFQEAFHPALIVSAALVALASFALLRVSRSVLEVGDLFPELRRVPILRPLLGI